MFVFIPATIIAIELLISLPLKQSVTNTYGVALKAFSVISSSSISDQWKEKALQRYSLQLFGYSLRTLLYLVLIISAFMLAAYLGWYLAYPSTEGLIDALLNWQAQLSIALTGIIYGVIRKKASNANSDYSVADRFLHRLALGSNTFKRVTFDLNTSLSSSKNIQNQNTNPVYVSGLARSGTTILLQALYESGEFASLTYRDMPFVMAPLLWQKISGWGQQSSELRERAHKDGIMVNYDSPEAFEEVFWLTFNADQYVKPDGLLAYQCNDQTLAEYTQFVSNLIVSRSNDKAQRYLSKNNNNVLRIDSLKKIYPESVIIVPFRDPVEQANSLLKQHCKFLEEQSEDPFVLKYMNWLGHFEFGQNFKPFRLASEERMPDISSNELGYWIQYWTVVYKYILQEHASRVVFFSYENFCSRPQECMEKLSSILQMEPHDLLKFCEMVKAPAKYVEADTNDEIVEQAYSLYRDLNEKAL